MVVRRLRHQPPLQHDPGEVAAESFFAAKFAAVLYAQSHVPNFIRKKGVLHFNPGSRYPRRSELPVTVGLLTEGEDRELRAKIIPLTLALAASSFRKPVNRPESRMRGTWFDERLGDFA
jgi:hypothetical protein